MLAENYIKDLFSLRHTASDRCLWPARQRLSHPDAVCQKGIALSAGFKKQVLTFIFVEDLVKVIFDCIEKGIAEKNILLPITIGIPMPTQQAGAAGTWQSMFCGLRFRFDRKPAAFINEN